MFSAFRLEVVLEQRSTYRFRAWESRGVGMEGQWRWSQMYVAASHLNFSSTFPGLYPSPHLNGNAKRNMA
jgi:hypothetical protein